MVAYAAHAHNIALMSIYTLNPPEFPALWACAWGQDPQGYWQALELNGVQQIMRWIPPGEFQMGSLGYDPDYYSEDVTLHHVTLTRGYWMAETACTQRLWLAVMGVNPNVFTESLENSVESVSWQDCQQFFSAANALLPEGFQLRFPTEAEWEYACCAKSQTIFSWGDSLSTEQANYDGGCLYYKGEKGEYRDRAVEVLSFNTNPWGLYQMQGKVWEWCADWYDDYSYLPEIDPLGASDGHWRVRRGGTGLGDKRFFRSVWDYAREPDFRSRSLGFRLVGS